LSDRSSFASSTYTQSPSEADEANQFDDAEEENNSPQSLQSPVMATTPFGESRNGAVTAGPIVPGRLSLRNPPRPAVARPGPRPNSAFATMSAPAVPARSTYPGYQEGGDKENASAPRRELAKSGNHKPLGLAIQTGGQMDIFGGGEGVSNGRIPKKIKAPTSAATPVLVSPIMSLSPVPAAAKGSWFASLFNWKQLTFVLQSYERTEATRAECKKLLESFGGQVILEGSDRSANLKCRFDELRDYSGSATSLKAVRFKVEFAAQNATGNPLSSPRNNTGVACTVTLIMEKGAHSTFKAVSSQLKRHWQLDQAPQTSYSGMR